jgi:hypothetical protein
MFTLEMSSTKKEIDMPVFLNPRAHRTPYGEFPTVDVPSGWPEPHLIPRKNDPVGESIVAFIARWRGHPGLADGPWDDRTGTINLIPPDQPRPETDPVPRYRLKEFGALGPGVYAKGAEVFFSGWPTRPSLLEAVNTSASLVLGYMTRCAGRPLPATMPHSGGVLNLPSPGLDGLPLNYSHRASGVFGDAA